MNHRKTLLIAALATAYFNAAAANSEVTAFNNQVEFSGLNPSKNYQIEIKLPNGSLKSMPFHSAETLSIAASDLGMKTLADGQYKFQIRPLESSKSDRSTHSDSKNITSESKPDINSGVFTIKNGQTITDQDEETRDQQILDDLIVDGSACIGQDCVNGESFGFDTLRLKENNLRIKFQDTSVSASFPSNDWQLTANDSNNGGANKFSIDDVTGAKTPFTIEAGAPSHSLFVDDGGRIGFGTSTPVVENHIVSGDTPTVRLEQNGSSGWTPQIWDMAGNETNFFVRDVTNSSKLPFRIRAGAPNDSIYVAQDGKIGFGTSTPSHGLHLKRSDNVTLRLENSATQKSWKVTNKGDSLQFAKVGTINGIFEYFDDASLQIGPFANRTLDLDSSGNLTIGGALVQNSDVNSKENIQNVDTSIILNKIMSLPISKWNYKFDDDSIKHLGPMAQDFFKIFNLGSREDRITSIDTSGVALAAIKELGNKNLETEDKVKALEIENAELKIRLENLEKLLLIKSN